MIRIFLPLICAALGVAAASCSQSEGPLAPAEAPAATPATPHGTASAATAVVSTPAAQAPGVPADASPTADASPPADAPPPGSQPSAGQSAADTGPAAPASAPLERRASTVMGMPVVAPDGTPLGEVTDIIFDRRGETSHLVISFDVQPDAGATAPGDKPAPSGQPTPSGPPAAGDSRKLTAIPWDAAMATVKDGRLVVDRAKLQDAPSFTADTWPNLDDPSWSAASDIYWRKAVRAAIAAHPGTPIDPTSRQRARPTRSDGGDGD